MYMTRQRKQAIAMGTHREQAIPSSKRAVHAAARRHPVRSPLAATAALLAIGLLAAPPAGSRTAPAARAARTFTLSETGVLHLVRKHGFTLYEQGTATGTVRGMINAVLKIVSTKRVTAEVTIYAHGGSITGTAAAAYRRQTTFASFSGSMSIVRGSGSYSHASGSGLSFSGTIQRSNDAVTMHLSGRVSY
jgi:hypothetical protein